MTATTVLLTGEAKKRFGARFRLHLETRTPAEAIRALCATVAGFHDYLFAARGRGIEFAVWRGRGAYAENIGYGQLREPAGDTIRIAPVPMGAKNGGVLQTIAGAVLFVVGGFISAWTWGAAGGVGGAMMAAGVGMMAGGVVQMLTPLPKINQSIESSGNQPSYIFNGAVNVTAQGNCVPVLYGGPLEIGSTVMSARIDAMDYSSRPTNVGMGTVNGNAKTSPYQAD